jgi:hypothetical protein
LKVGTQIAICTHICSTTAITRSESNPSDHWWMDKYVRRSGYTQWKEILTQAATRINLEDLMLSQSHTHTHTHTQISVRFHLYEVPRVGKFLETENQRACQELGGGDGAMVWRIQSQLEKTQQPWRGTVPRDTHQGESYCAPND